MHNSKVSVVVCSLRNDFVVLSGLGQTNSKCRYQPGECHFWRPERRNFGQFSTVSAFGEGISVSIFDGRFSLASAAAHEAYNVARVMGVKVRRVHFGVERFVWFSF